jgi:hypothetical protein
MLKCLALDERYRNIRGAAHAGHDREEARIHAADIVAILSAQEDLVGFSEKFRTQFGPEPDLGSRIKKIVEVYFKDLNAPGLLLYEEFLANSSEASSDRRTIEGELGRAKEVLKYLLTAT